MKMDGVIPKTYITCLHWAFYNNVSMKVWVNWTKSFKIDVLSACGCCIASNDEN